MAFEEITNPTWEYPIRSFFNDIDINHMLTQTNGKLNLGIYDHVKARGKEIYERVSGKKEDGSDSDKRRMPDPPSQLWSQDMLDLYKKWMDNGYPER